MVIKYALKIESRLLQRVLMVLPHLVKWKACTIDQADESGENERAKHTHFRLNNPQGQLAAYVFDHVSRFSAISHVVVLNKTLLIPAPTIHNIQIDKDSHVEKMDLISYY